MYSTLATKLRVLRAERGLTVREVAERSGVAKETISQAERGERRPYDRTLAKLAKAYGVPVEELLGPAESEEKPPAADIAPRLTREQFVEHGIEPTSAEIATLNELLKVYTEMAQMAQSGEEQPRTLTVPEGPVDLQRVHMLAYYAARSGLLTQEDMKALDTGVRAQLAAGR
jgi:transcriptional regulator with XRE-family HTH domain